MMRNITLDLVIIIFVIMVMPRSLHRSICSCFGVDGSMQLACIDHECIEERAMLNMNYWHHSFKYVNVEISLIQNMFLISGLNF